MVSSVSRARHHATWLFVLVLAVAFVACAEAASAGHKDRGAPGASEQDPVALRAGQFLREALAYLQAQGLNIIYSTKNVGPWMRVRHTPQATDPVGILQEILAHYQLAAEQGPDGSWLVVKIASSDTPPGGSVRGRVVDGTSGAPLANVEVRIDHPTKKTRSAPDGGFTLENIEPGTHTLHAVVVGYESHSIEDIRITPDGVSNVEIRLQRKPEKLENVTVVASRYRLLSNAPSGAQFLSRQEVDRLPHLADDLQRAIKRLPGAVAGEISAKLNMRGGVRDETLLILDGLELQDPFHLKILQGALSIVDSNIVDGVDVLSGGFTAEYGDRMSGVIEVETITPGENRESAVGVSFVNAFARTQGSFGQSRGRWLVSVRRGYLDYLFDLADASGEIQPRYYDALAKLQYDLGDRTSLQGNFLFARDDFFLEEDDTIEQSIGDATSYYGWFSIINDWSEDLYAETILSLGDVMQERRGTENDVGSLFADVRDRRDIRFAGIKTDWGWSLTDHQLLKWGAEARHLEADYDYAVESAFINSFFTAEPVFESRQHRLSPDGDEYSAYLAHRWQIVDPMILELGLRWDKQTYTDLEDDDQLSPRVNLLYEFGPRTSLRAAWGRFYQSQGIDELQVEDGVTEFFPVQLAEHRILGLDHQLGPNLSLRVEAYQKLYSDLRPRFENVFDPHEVIPEAEVDRVRIAPESAEARGIELMLKRDGPRNLSWWASYTYSKVEDRVEGEDVPRAWDQPHALGFSLNWEGDKWNVNVAGSYRSAWPITAVDGELVENPDGGLDVRLKRAERNRAELGPYHRVDVRVSRDVTMRRGEFTYFFELYNVFNHRNPCCIDGFNIRTTPSLEVHVEPSVNYWMKRLPSFGFTWTF